MRLALIAAFTVVSACIPAQGTRPQIGGRPGDGGREITPGRTTQQSGLGSKKVSGKEDPNVLLAADVMRCTFSEAKFRETAIGESVLCAWSK